MVIEKTIEYPVNLMKKYPRVVLPNILSWISVALINVIVILALSDLLSYVGSLSSPQLLYIPTVADTIIPLLFYYIAIMIPVFVLAFCINIFIQAVYPSIIKQSFTKKILLTQAFSVARKRFWSLLVAELIVIIIMVISAAALFVPAYLLLVISPVIGMIVMMLFLIIFLVGLFYLVIGTWQLAPVVVLEGKGGIDAIKRSFALAKNNMLNIVIILLILGIIISVINFSVGIIPVVGDIIVLIVGLFTSAWIMMAPTVFYFYKDKKERKAPSSYTP